MHKVYKTFLPTKLGLLKPYNSVRNNVYHAQRIVLKCAIRHFSRAIQLLQ